MYTGPDQLGVVPHMWDPFVGEHSTYLVTHSRMSKLLPSPGKLLRVGGTVRRVGAALLGDLCREDEETLVDQPCPCARIEDFTDACGWQVQEMRERLGHLDLRAVA